MIRRTRTPVALPALAAACLAFAVSASSAWAQVAVAQTSAPGSNETLPARHIDIDAGVGVHIGLKNDTPLDDDFSAVFGLAAPISEHFDGELQATYLTGGRDRNVGDGSAADSKNVFFVTPGFRWYPFSAANAAARVYLATGPAMLINYHDNDELALGWSIGPGVRLRAGKRSGLLVRLPIVFDIEHDSNSVPRSATDPKKHGREAIIIPTLSYFFQF